MSTAVSCPGQYAVVKAALPATATERAPERLVLLLTEPTSTGAGEDARALTGRIRDANAAPRSATKRRLRLMLFHAPEAGAVTSRTVLLGTLAGCLVVI